MKKQLAIALLFSVYLMAAVFFSLMLIQRESTSGISESIEES
jgi:hypothetical protein